MIKRLLLVGSYNASESTVREEILKSHPKLSATQLFSTYLFDSQEEFDQWMERSWDIEVNCGKRYWACTMSRDDHRMLIDRFFRQFQDQIEKLNPDVIMVHVGQAFRFFDREIRCVLARLREKFPNVRMALDTPEFRWASISLTQYRVWPITPEGEVLTFPSRSDIRLGEAGILVDDYSEGEPRDEYDYALMWPFDESADIVELARLLRSTIYEP